MKSDVKVNKFIDINTGLPRKKKNRKQKREEKNNRKKSLINLPSSSVSVPKFPTAKQIKSSIRQSKKIARSNSMELQKAKQRENAFKKELRQAMENDRRANEERYKRKAEQRKREEQEREERQRAEQSFQQQYDSIDYTTVALLNFRAEIASFPDGIAEPCLAIMDNLQQSFGDDVVATALYNMNTRFYEIVQRSHFDSDSVARDLESSILANIKEIIPEDSWQELGIEWSELEQAFDEAEGGYDVQ